MAPPADILKRVWDVYQACRTYEDTGEVISLSFSDRGKSGRRLPFSTSFVRPDLFRYEFSEQDNDLSDKKFYVVWSDGSEVRSWWSVRPGVQSFPSILDALAGPTGVSGGSASRMPSLLLGNRPESSSLMRDFGAASEATQEDIDGQTCIRLHIVNSDPAFQERKVPPPPPEMAARMGLAGHHPPRSFRVRWEWKTLWISQADSTIRRAADRTSFDSHVSESTITWNPRLDLPLGRDRFGFTPPEQSA